MHRFSRWIWLLIPALLLAPALLAQQNGGTQDSGPGPYTGPPPGKKLPVLDDVNMIGDRTCGNGIDFYSQEKETELGRALSQQVLKSSKVITDPEVNEYINRLAQNLVRNSDAKIPFEVHVLQDDSINAFALPGGFFFINTGLILGVNEEDELAGAMAHEITHVICRHATRNMTKAELEQLATIPVLIMTPGVAGLAASEAAGVAIPMQYLKFSRAAEAQADFLGIQYLWKAGYDPNGLVRAFEVLEEDEKEKPGIMSGLFENHPQTPDRIAASEKEIATIIPPRPEYIVSTSEFDIVQARLRALLKKNIETDVRVPQTPNGAPPPPAATSGPPIIKH